MSRTICTYPGCHDRADIGHKRCAKHRSAVSEARRAYDAARIGSEARALYKSERWERIRHVALCERPLCEDCLDRGTIELATEVHHVKAHRGDPDLFYDPGNLRNLCKACHSSHTARGE